MLRVLLAFLVVTAVVTGQYVPVFPHVLPEPPPGATPGSGTVPGDTHCLPAGTADAGMFYLPTGRLVLPSAPTIGIWGFNDSAYQQHYGSPPVPSLAPLAIASPAAPVFIDSELFAYPGIPEAYLKNIAGMPPQFGVNTGHVFALLTLVPNNPGLYTLCPSPFGPAAISLLSPACGLVFPIVQWEIAPGYIVTGSPFGVLPSWNGGAVKQLNPFGLAALAVWTGTPNIFGLGVGTSVAFQMTYMIPDNADPTVANYYIYTSWPETITL